MSPVVSGFNPACQLFFLFALFGILVAAITFFAVFLFTFTFFRVFLIAASAMGVGGSDRGNNDGRGDEE